MSMKPEAQTEALPQAIEIEKDGATTRLFNAVTGKQIEGDIKVKLDFTSGKDCKATLSFEVAVTDIRVLEKQLAFFGEDNGTSSTPPYSVSLEAPIALMSKKAPNKAAR